MALLTGLAVAALITLPIAMGKNPETGKIYFWEIMIPGAMVGLIVGYATQKFAGRLRRVPEPLQLLKRNSSTSPSCTTYSLPSARARPCSRAGFQPPTRMNSA